MAHELDETLAALADPTRREIVEFLRSERRRPGEIADTLGVSRTALSRHLRVLRDAGLIDEEVDARDARSRFLQLDPGPLSELQTWLDEVSAFWTDQLDAFVAHAEQGGAPVARARAGARAVAKPARGADRKTPSSRKAPGKVGRKVGRKTRSRRS